MKNINNKLFCENWEGIILEILKTGTMQNAKMRPLAVHLHMQWEEDSLKTWLKSLDGHSVIMDQCCGTVKERVQLQWNKIIRLAKRSKYYKVVIKLSLGKLFKEYSATITQFCFCCVLLFIDFLRKLDTWIVFNFFIYIVCQKKRVIIILTCINHYLYGLWLLCDPAFMWVDIDGICVPCFISADLLFVTYLVGDPVCNKCSTCTAAQLLWSRKPESP